jgi:signal transduction histidine kinase
LLSLDGFEVVVVPLRAHFTASGALVALLRDGHGAVDLEERELLASFAGHARAAVEQARLYARLQEERERAQAAERTQREFVSMVSHELRTPLALIKGYVATLQRRSLGLPPEMQDRFLEGIDSAGDRLRRLIDNLLTATAVEANAFVYRPKPLDVGTVLRDAVAEVTMLARGRKVDLQIGGEALYVLGDDDQLVQVVENLIGNALKYAPGETPVLVSAVRRDSQVRITVRDAGPGIPEAALELIFEKFYRVQVTHGLHDAGLGSPPSPDHKAAHAEHVDPSAPPAPTPAPTPKDRRQGQGQGGVGLGLYICRRIVEAHGGRIWAENGRDGGAAFHIEVPAVLGPPPPAGGVQLKEE